MIKYDPDRVKNRFLTDLKLWLNDGLCYYAFTGEPVHWHWAFDDYHRKLLEEAEAKWPERLRRIEQQRQLDQKARQAKNSKK